MVIGKTFAWGHLPKTGGDATLRLFSVFPEIVVFADDRAEHAKHTFFRDREGEITGKRLALNIRRLPSWIVSWAHQLERGAPGFPPKEMATPAEMVEWDVADRMIRAFTDDGRFTIDHWIRMEHLKDDFLAFIAQQAEISTEKKVEVAAAPMVNTMEYDHDVLNWFTEQELARLYERNPRWAEIERREYEEG